MKGKIRDFTLLVGRMDRRHIRLVLLVMTLILFVLGGGAPEDGGGVNCPGC